MARSDRQPQLSSKLRVIGALLLVGAFIVGFGSHALTLASIKRNADMVISTVDAPGVYAFDLEPGEYVWVVPISVVPPSEVAGNRPSRPKLDLAITDEQAGSDRATVRDPILRETIRASGVQYTVLGEVSVDRAGTIEFDVQGDPGWFPVEFRKDPLFAAVRAGKQTVVFLGIAIAMLFGGVILLLVHRHRLNQALIADMDTLE